MLNKITLLSTLAATFLLTGCQTYEPVTRDDNDRAVVPGVVAAAMFIVQCYKSPDGKVAKKSGKYNPETRTSEQAKIDKELRKKNPSTLKSSFTGEHKTLAINYVAITTRDDYKSCGMEFVGNKVSAESAAEAATILSLFLKTPAKGKKGGGQITYKTPSGTVNINNGSKRHPQGFGINYVKFK